MLRVQLRSHPGSYEPLKKSSANRRWFPITENLYHMHGPALHSLLPVGSDPAGKVFKEPIFQAPLTSRDVILEVIMGSFFQ